MCTFRQFAAALADLYEASRLCPSNREISRLLARVEEECRQLQRPGGKGQLPLKHESDQEEDEDDDDEEDEGEEEGEDGEDAEEEEHGLLGRQLEEEEENVYGHMGEERGRKREAWRKQQQQQQQQGRYPLTRTLPDALTHGPAPTDPPPAPRRQSQRAKSGGRSGSVGGKSAPQCGSSSPLPSRHLPTGLKAGPCIHLGPGAPEDAPDCKPYRCPSLSDGMPPPGSVARATERLEMGVCAGRDSEGVGGGGGNVRMSSSSSSLASSGVLSDGGRNKSAAADRMAVSPSETGGVSWQEGVCGGASGEHKPRPFMGIMDKTARFQQQQQQQQLQQPSRHHGNGRSWHGYPAESYIGHTTGGGGGQAPGMNCDLGYSTSQTGSTYHEHLYPLAAGLHNGSHAHGAADMHPGLALQQHYGNESKLKQASLARDNPIHMSSIKPKRSFIESNV